MKKIIIHLSAFCCITSLYPSESLEISKLEQKVIKLKSTLELIKLSEHSPKLSSLLLQYNATSLIDQIHATRATLSKKNKYLPPLSHIAGSIEEELLQAENLIARLKGQEKSSCSESSSSEEESSSSESGVSESEISSSSESSFKEESSEKDETDTNTGETRYDIRFPIRAEQTVSYFTK